MTENKCTFFHFFFEKKGISDENVLRSRKLLITNHLCGGLNAHFYKLLVANYINKNCCQVTAFFNNQSIKTMELLGYGVVWTTLCCLFAAVLFELNYPKKVVKSGLGVAYEISLHKAEERQVLIHKWLESEKAGYDIGMEKAQESWEQHHKDNWRKSKSA